MAEKPALNPDMPRRKRGCPSRKEEVERALAELGVDPALVDPRRVLASIAGDTSAPAGARVAACRALLGMQDQPIENAGGDARINERAIAMMMRRAN